MIRAVLIVAIWIISFNATADVFASLKIDRPLKVITAPTFNLVDLNGNTVRLSDFDDGVVILNFWATFCTPCLKEMPSMERLWQAYKTRGLTILAVTVENDRYTAINQYAKKYSLNFPILFDREEAVSLEYGVSYFPVSYLIQHGKILGKAVGTREWDGDDARRLMNSLLP